MLKSLFNKNKVILPDILKKFYSIFEAAGFEAYLVGGAVRDMFLNKAADDWDVATNAKPEDVMKLFKMVIPTGIAHGTVTVHFMNNEIEVTTFRTESDYSDGRHPDKVNYAATIEEDLSRRDFTMNAIAVNLKNGEIVDPFSGQKDIKNRIIRTVGNPTERFMEDGLRPIRALRFATKLGFKIEYATYNEISRPEILNKISMISLERFRDEFIKILSSEKPSFGLKLMEQTGILKLFIPELSDCRNVNQTDYRCFHEFDVLDHLFYACDGAPKDNLIVRIAALFHDIGKPEAREIKACTVIDGDVPATPSSPAEKTVETVTFYRHEIFGEKITRKILTRIKFSNDEINKVCHLVKEHMFHYESTWTDAAVRRFIVRVNPECINDLFDLRVADVYGMHNQAVNLRSSQTSENLIELKDRIKEILLQQNALSLKDLKVSGKDLINAGIPAGKLMGTILKELMEAVIEDPSQNEKGLLLKIAENIYKQSVP